MLLTPALALFGILFNFYALVHITSDWDGLASRRWHALGRAIHSLEETTVTVYENYLDIVTPPPLTSSPVYLAPIRRAEWVYRSSAVRVLDLIDSSSKVQTTSDVAASPLLSLSPTDSMGPVASAGIIPPTLTSPTHPATFGPSPTYDPLSVATTSSRAQFWSLACFASCVVCALVFTWFKNRRYRRSIMTPRPVLTCDVHCQIPVEDFHSVNTATPMPSYSGTEGGFSEFRSERFQSHSHNTNVGLPSVSRTFPVVITNSDGQALFKAEIQLSSNHVITELTATASTVSFSIDVVASMDIPTVSEWYMPTRDDGGVPCKAEDSLFLLLVRGSNDRPSLSEESQNSDYASELEGEPPSVEKAQETVAQALGPDCDAEDTSTCYVPPLGSPMCPVTVPFHWRGFSAFETALINSGKETRRENAHKGNCSHRREARNSIRPRDVRFAWLKDIYTCGDSHLDGCDCEEALAEHAIDEKHPHPQVLSKIFHDHDRAPEFDRDAHSGERGSGMRKQAHTVSPGLSVRSEMSPTGIFDPAKPRPTAHSEPLLAGGKELAGRDSTVALMPSFSVVSSELPLRCRSSGISTPEEFSDEGLGEQSMSLEEDDIRTGFTHPEFAGITHPASGSCSPLSPVVPAQVDLMMGALEPLLAGYASPPSPEEAALVHPAPISSPLDYSPLQYSPSSDRAHSPARHTATPEYDDWAGESTEDDDVDPESVLETEPQFPTYRLQELAIPSTPRRTRSPTQSA